MRTRGPKKTSTVIITLTITVVIVTALIIGIMMLIMKKEPVNIADNNQGSVMQEVATGKFYENGWDSSVVAEIRDGVPVPTGYTYVSGEKETGLIIQNEENGKQYVWIPYDEEVASDETLLTDEVKFQEIDTYFEGKEEVSINPDKLAEIQKYGGFYAGIEYLENSTQDDTNENEDITSNITTVSLGDMTLEQYNKAYQEISNQYTNSESVNGSIMSKEEAGMILSFTQKQDIDNTISTTLLTSTEKRSDYKCGDIVYAKNGAIAYSDYDVSEPARRRN